MRGVRAVSAGGTVLLGVLLASVVPAGAGPVYPGSVHGAHASRSRAAVAGPLAGLTALARAGRPWRSASRTPARRGRSARPP
jgi:hypothetical protein